MIAARLLNAIRRDGAKAIVRLPLGLLRRLATWRSVWFFLLDTPPSPAPDCALLSPDAARALIADDAFPWHDEAMLAERFASGSRLYGVRKNDQWVCFGWVSFTPRFFVGELGRWVEFPEPTTWIWDCVTPAPFRGRGHYVELLHGIASLEGKFPIAIFCTEENASSRRGIEKAGFRLAFRIARHVAGALTRRAENAPSFRSFG